MIKFKSQIELIENEIDKYINSLKENPLYDSVKYFLKLPSKRVRPLFTLLTNSLYNSDHSFAIPAALSNEMFHNFTLLHDDIMDSSKKRRGFETVHEKWNVNQAILSGDSMWNLKCLGVVENLRIEFLDLLSFQFLHPSILLSHTF